MRKPTIFETFWDHVDKTGECWEWQRALNRGHGYGVLRTPDGRTRLAHIVAYEKTRGSTNGLWVLHRCDNHRCVRPDHLFLGTPKDNSLDMVRKGRAGSRKLNLQQVAEIRTSTEGAKALAERYGVSRQAIWKVKTGAFYVGL